MISSMKSSGVNCMIHLFFTGEQHQYLLKEDLTRTARLSKFTHCRRDIYAYCQIVQKTPFPIQMKITMKLNEYFKNQMSTGENKNDPLQIYKLMVEAFPKKIVTGKEYDIPEFS